MFKKTHKLLKAQSGQSLIEAVVVSFLLIASLQGLFVLSWISVQKIWMEHQLYQAVLCVAEQKAKIKCESQLMQNIQSFNRLGRLKLLFISEKKGELVWRFYKKDFLIQQSLVY